MTKELKPCPFQKEGETHDVRFVELKPGYGQVGCADCGFWFPSDEMLTKAEAIERWNTRCKRTCRIVIKQTDSDYRDGWHYLCSECGFPIEVGEADVFADGSTPIVLSHAAFCWHCGAEVVDD